MLAEERPDHKLKIQIIDSHTYSMPYGWYFCECARKVRNGGELSTCVDELKRKLDCVEICLAAYSLKQMKKSGRVSAAAAVVGDLLGIRPIISLNAGVSKVEAKVRGDAAVPPAMIKWVESRVDSMKDTPYMVAYTSSTAKRDELVKLCKKNIWPCADDRLPAGWRGQRQHRPGRYCHCIRGQAPQPGGLHPGTAVILGMSNNRRLSPPPALRDRLRGRAPVAARHLPTLWGVTLAEGAFTKENEIFAAAYCKGLRLLL